MRGKEGSLATSSGLARRGGFRPDGCAMGADLFASAHVDVNSLWSGLADHLRSRLGAQQFAVWFGTATAVSVAAGRLTVALPNEFTRRWVAGHFDEELRR